MSLVSLKGQFINTDEMAEVWRNGNYTVIRLKDKPESWQFVSMWDEDNLAWNAIEAAVGSPK